MIDQSHVWRTHSHLRWWRRGTLARLASGGALACVVAYGLAWVPAALRHRTSRAPDRALAAQAARLALTYEDARRAPAAHKGQPVAWLITRIGDGYFYGGDPALPIRWSGPAPALPPADKHGYGERLVCVVEGAGPEGVVLTYRGRQ